MKKDLIMQSSARNQIKTRFKKLGLDLDITKVEESPIIPKSSDKKRATRSTTSWSISIFFTNFKNNGSIFKN